MELLNQLLPIILYILGIMLLVVLIILGIKLIKSVDRVNLILDDAEQKLRSLDHLFHMVDSITDTLSTVSDTIFSRVSMFIHKIFRRKRKEEEY